VNLFKELNILCRQSNVLTSFEIGQIYNINGVINEPHTWINGEKMVQLIRPVSTNPLSTIDEKGN